MQFKFHCEQYSVLELSNAQFIAAWIVVITLILQYFLSWQREITFLSITSAGFVNLHLQRVWSSISVPWRYFSEAFGNLNFGEKVNGSHLQNVEKGQCIHPKVFVWKWRAAMKSKSITDKMQISVLQKTVLRTCKRNAPLCFSTEQPLKSLAAFEITAPDYTWAVHAIIYIKHPSLWHLLLLLSGCLLNPCWSGDSKSQKDEEECYFYLLAWKFSVSFSMAGLDTHLRPHSSWP